MQTKSANGYRYLPDFICVGAQKSGTTTLYNVLRKHTEIYLPKTKELHYFDHKELKPLECIEREFKESSAHQKKGDITPYYMFHESGAQNIYNVVPHARILILLRDPVERSLSHYWHAVSKGYEPMKPIEAFELEKKRISTGRREYHQRNSYMSRSKYMHQIERMEKYFRKEQILIVKSEKLFSGDQSEWNKIYEHIGVKWQKVKIEASNRRTIEIDEELNESARKYLSKALENSTKEIKEKKGISWN